MPGSVIKIVNDDQIHLWKINAGCNLFLKDKVHSMKKIYFLFFPAILGIWMASCKSATKLYEKGNYDEAVEVAVKKLQKDPNNSELKNVVKNSYRYAVTGHENNIRNYSQSNNELKPEWLYNEYAALQNLYTVIFKSPEAFEYVHPTDYSTYVNEYAVQAAEVHYNHGMQWMNNNDRQSFKTAYREFQIADRFNPGDGNIRQMMDKAYENALTKVVIIPADGFGFQYSSYNYQLQNFDNDIIRNLQYNSGNEFVKFFSASEAQRQNIIPDEFVEMHFMQINLGRIDDKNSVKEISKEVVMKERIYKPDSVVKEYGKVKAQIITTQRTVVSEGILSMSIRNNTGKWLWNDKIIGSHNWTTTFTTYTGDERALGDEEKKLLKKERDKQPAEAEIIRHIKENVYNEFISRIRNYYSRY